MLIGFTLRNNEPTLVIWLAYSEELCEQAVTEFQKAWECLRLAPSHVLQAMNFAQNLIEGALRIGIGKFTTKAEIEKTSSLIINAVNKIQQLL